MRVSLPTSREEFALLVVLAASAAAINRSLLLALPFVVLVLASLNYQVSSRRVYRPDPDAEVRTLFNAPEVEESEERVIEAALQLNLGGAAAVLSAVYLSALHPLESVTVFVATLPVAYLASRTVTGVGVVQDVAVGVVPVMVALIITSPVAGLAGGVPAIAVSQAAYLSLDESRERSAPEFSIGGRGVFGGLFLSVVLPLALTGL
ncbi:MAG: hypothetical protein MAG715_00951 [Methanonatronarchaeales archaeon]|nr:hypothetical protein [Methanonatronarchaeales archaeon]